MDRTKCMNENIRVKKGEIIGISKISEDIQDRILVQEKSA